MQLLVSISPLGSNRPQKAEALPISGSGTFRYVLVYVPVRSREAEHFTLASLCAATGEAHLERTLAIWPECRRGTSPKCAEAKFNPPSGSKRCCSPQRVRGHPMQPCRVFWKVSLYSLRVVKDDVTFRYVLPCITLDGLMFSVRSDTFCATLPCVLKSVALFAACFE